MLYIANSTRQNFRFHFRIPENNKAMTLEIPSGQQREVGKDWNEAQYEACISQLERYGARKAEEAHGALRNFNSGILYSHKIIKSDEIVYGNEQHLDAAQDRSVTQATRTALAADQNHRDKRTKKRKAKSVTTEVLKHGDPRKGEDEGLMSVTVSDDGARDAKLPV